MKIFSNKFSLWKKKAKVVTVLFLYSSSIFTKPVRSKRRRHCTMYQRKKFRSKNILLKRGWGNGGGCWCPWFRRSDCHFWIEQVFNFQISCLFLQKLSYGDIKVAVWALGAVQKQRQQFRRGKGSKSGHIYQLIVKSANMGRGVSKIWGKCQHLFVIYRGSPNLHKNH